MKKVKTMLPLKELDKMYHGKKMTIREVAKAFGVSPFLVWNHLLKLKNKTRTISEARLLYHKKNCKIVTLKNVKEN